MNLGIFRVLTSDEVDTIHADILSLKKIWRQRINWHPTNDAGGDEDLENYIHYHTLGATLYMDASDYGWKHYMKFKTLTNQILMKKFGWLYDEFKYAISEALGEECEYEGELALPGFHIYHFDRQPKPKHHHRCLHIDGQFMNALPWLARKYGGDIDVQTPLSYTFTITRPSRGSAIAFWGLPDELSEKAEEVKKRYPHPITERYENLDYVKQIREGNFIERPWKYKLFDEDPGDLASHIPHVFPHTPGHSFFYTGKIIHQMILGDQFEDGDSRITFQGHGLKINGQWKLFW